MSLSSIITYHRKKILKLLEDQGYSVIPIPGGIFDLIAINDTHVRFIIIRYFSSDLIENTILNKVKEMRFPEWTIKEVWEKKSKKKDLYDVEIL